MDWIWMIAILVIHAVCIAAGLIWRAVGLIRVRIKCKDSFERDAYRRRVLLMTRAVMLGPIAILIYAFFSRPLERLLMPFEVWDFLHFHDDLEDEAREARKDASE